MMERIEARVERVGPITSGSAVTLQSPSPGRKGNNTSHSFLFFKLLTFFKRKKKKQEFAIFGHDGHNFRKTCPE
jgi:hypothetical protein